MGDFNTTQGRLVEHCHIGMPPCEDAELTPIEIQRARNLAMQIQPDAVEVNPPTNKYNCIGFAFARSHGWFEDDRVFCLDDCTVATFTTPERGDAVIYTRFCGFIHVGLVARVSNGRITRVVSKWGNWAELCHRLEISSGYGRPTILLRPRPGVVSLMDLPECEEMLEPTGVAPSLVLRGGEKMPEYESTEEAIEWALGRISDPDVFTMVGLASTPRAARIIIADLSGVQELIEIGTEAAPAILRLLKRAEDQHERGMIGIALYLLQRIPVKDARKPLAESLLEGKYTGINLSLAVDALLTSAGIELVKEDPITVALRAAEKIRSQE